jgi:hypothetical protein
MRLFACTKRPYAECQSSSGLRVLGGSRVGKPLRELPGSLGKLQNSAGLNELISERIVETLPARN